MDVAWNDDRLELWLDARELAVIVEVFPSVLEDIEDETETSCQGEIVLEADDLGKHDLVADVEPFVGVAMVELWNLTDPEATMDIFEGHRQNFPDGRKVEERLLALDEGELGSVATVVRRGLGDVPDHVRGERLGASQTIRSAQLHVAYTVLAELREELEAACQENGSADEPEAESALEEEG